MRGITLELPWQDINGRDLWSENLESLSDTAASGFPGQPGLWKMRVLHPFKWGDLVKLMGV